MESTHLKFSDRWPPHSGESFSLFRNIPNEILFFIFQNLKENHLKICAQVCFRWAVVALAQRYRDYASKTHLSRFTPTKACHDWAALFNKHALCLLPQKIRASHFSTEISFKSRNSEYHYYPWICQYSPYKAEIHHQTRNTTFTITHSQPRYFFHFIPPFLICSGEQTDKNGTTFAVDVYNFETEQRILCLSDSIICSLRGSPTTSLLERLGSLRCPDENPNVFVHIMRKNGEAWIIKKNRPIIYYNPDSIPLGTTFATICTDNYIIIEGTHISEIWCIKTITPLYQLEKRQSIIFIKNSYAIVRDLNDGKESYSLVDLQKGTVLWSCFVPSRFSLVTWGDLTDSYVFVKIKNAHMALELICHRMDGTIVCREQISSGVNEEVDWISLGQEHVMQIRFNPLQPSHKKLVIRSLENGKVLSIHNCMGWAHHGHLFIAAIAGHHWPEQNHLRFWDLEKMENVGGATDFARTVFPKSISFDGGDAIYVDFTNATVQKFNFSGVGITTSTAGGSGKPPIPFLQSH